MFRRVQITHSGALVGFGAFWGLVGMARSRVKKRKRRNTPDRNKLGTPSNHSFSKGEAGVERLGARLYTRQGNQDTTFIEQQWVRCGPLAE